MIDERTTDGQATFGYDSSDRTTSITQGSQNTTYGLNVAGQTISRDVSNGTTSTTTDYGYTGNGESFAMTTGDTITDDYLSLPGGLGLTVYPGQTGAAKQTASLSNIEGDVIATVNGSNALSGTFTYDPFGNLISTGGMPSNASNSAAFGWEGGNGKLTETAMTLDPTLMGARVYIPSIGRFTSQDPDPGSLPNLYTYPLDPINGSDLSGECAAGAIACFSSSQVNAIQSTIAAAQVIEAVTTTIDVKDDEIEVRTASKPKSSATPSNSSRAANPPVSQVAAASVAVRVDTTGLTGNTETGEQNERLKFLHHWP